MGDFHSGYSDDTKDVQCRNVLSYDTSGSLYTLNQDGDLMLRDIREELLRRGSLTDVKAAVQGSTSQGRVLRLLPDLEYKPDDISISSSGSFAAICGTHRNDADQAGIALVDLGAAKQHQQSHSWAAVDEEHFNRHPGLTVLQMAWHPGSSAHLAVLTSDQSWQLYNVANLSMPEQHFKLQWQNCRSFGVDADSGRRAVAFAFGPQHSWQRFTVYFLCADGAVCALCPVAPFGAAMPASAVQGLAEAAASSDDPAHSPTTEAWIQQALSGPVSWSKAGGAASVHVLQHALEEHLPRLQGPFSLASAEGAADSLLSFAPSRDTAVDICTLRCGGATTALLVATSSGLLGAAVIAGDIAPQWAESEPFCVTDGAELKSVRSECPVGSSREQVPMLLLDLIDLGAQQHGMPSSSDADESRAPFVLLPHPAVPEQVFVRSTTAAWAVCLTWLPALSSWLSEDRESLQDARQLPRPIVEMLLSAKPGAAIVGACPVGDALTGTALMAATSDGKSHWLWPSGAGRPETDDNALSMSGTADAVSGEVEQIYGALLHGPKKQAATEGMGLPLRTPQGVKALSEAIHALLEGHVEYIHQGHHHLLPRLKELKEAGAKQKEDLERLRDLCSSVEQDREAFSSSLDRAEKLHNNLQSRLRILADLHWKLPRPLTAEEQRLRDVVLPSLEAAVGKLKHSLEGSKRSLRTMNSERKLIRQQSSGTPVVSSVQLRRTRAAVAEQAALTSSAKQALQQMQLWLQNNEEKCYA